MFWRQSCCLRRDDTLGLKFLLPDVEAQQGGCVQEGCRAGWVLGAFQPPGLCCGTTILLITRRGPVRADRSLRVLSVTTVVTWLLSSVREVGAWRDFFSRVPPQAWLSDHPGGRLVLPGPVWAGCSFIMLPRGLGHHTTL